MNNIKEELKSRVTRLHGSITPEQVYTFLQNNKMLVQTENARVEIIKMLNALTSFRYGKNPEDAIITSTCALILRNFERSLSIEDLKYVFNQAASGSITFELTDRYFSATSVIKLLRKYESMKQLIKKTYFEIQRENGVDNDGQQKDKEFTQQSLRKFMNGERLTFYEKSTVGKFYLDRIPQQAVESINGLVNDETVKLRQERYRKQQKNPFYPYEAERVDGQHTITMYENEDSPYEPLFITEQLVFGNLLFDFVVDNDVHKG